MDLSFQGINTETLLQANAKAMQFGRALERVLYQVRHANTRFGPVYMSKIDIADGFYRVWVQPRGVQNLGVVFPKYDSEEQMVAFLMVLPMGWIESPPYFCMVMETVTDLSNQPAGELASHPHPFDGVAD